MYRTVHNPEVQEHVEQGDSGGPLAGILKTGSKEKAVLLGAVSNGIDYCVAGKRQLFLGNMRERMNIAI